MNGYQIEEKEDVMIDLVCGMELNFKKSKFKKDYKGKTYHFCSENCKEHFEKSPEKYTE